MAEPVNRPPFDRFLAGALTSVHGDQATETLWNLRNERLDKYGRALAYEMVLDLEPADAWSRFVDGELPKLCTYLSSKKFGLFGGPQVLIAVWIESRMYLFDAPPFFDSVATLNGQTRGELEDRIRNAQQASAGSFVTQMLPPPKDSEKN